MNLSPQDTATVLLTVPLAKRAPSDARPLKHDEWNRLTGWLATRQADPATLLTGDATSVLEGWADSTVTAARLEELAGQGVALALALERWSRIGLWVLTDSNPEYPQQLKERLGPRTPPCLFGCGKMRLLGTPGIAVVGSRAASENDLAFTREFGEHAANRGFSVVSGGARGVDQNAMFGALAAEGTAVGVLADSLVRSAMSARYRRHLMDGDLTLVTPFNPEAGFNVGNAMARNRYIYCLAKAAVIVSSEHGKGGTWNGAMEALHKKWVPVWVKRSAAARSGNPELQKKGARLLPDGRDLIASWLEGLRPEPLEPLHDVARAADQGSEKRDSLPSSESIPDSHPPPPRDIDFYALYLAHMRELTIATDNARGAPRKEICAQLDLAPAQVGAWLKRGLNDGCIKKLRKPATYACPPPPPLLAACTESPDEASGKLPEFFSAFLKALDDVSDGQPMTPNDIASSLNLETAQTRAWLKRAQEEGKAKRSIRPVRFQVLNPQRLSNPGSN